MAIDKYYTGSGFPPQKLKTTEKLAHDGQWGKQCVDAIVGYTNSNSNNGRTSRERKLANYNLVNSKFDERDFHYVTDPLGISEKMGDSPARLQDFNIIRSKIELLKGEELKRKFAFAAIGVSGNVIEAKLEAKKAKIMEAVQEHILAAVGMQQDSEGNPINPPQLEKVLKEFDEGGYQDLREEMVNDLLKYLELKEDLPLKFNEGWEHALISSEEIHYVGIVNGHPITRVVNPIDFDFDRSPNQKIIEDSQWCVEERYMAKNTILDEFREFLTDEDVTKLDGPMTGGFGRSGGMFPGFAYGESDLPPNRITYKNSGTYNTGEHIPVYTVCWKGMREIGFLKYIDKKGEVQETLVDENFKLTREQKSLGWEVDYKWITEIYQGTKIGTDIFVNVGPLANQTGKLPYIGRIYNSVNSEATSVVDLAKPAQFTYMIVWYRLLLELAKAKGKKMVIPINAIPKSMGMDMDTWLNYFDNVGIAFINEFEEGTEDGQQGMHTKFNQYASIDMTISESIRQYLAIAGEAKAMVDEITGISKQREGQISASETATGTSAAVSYSANITEPLFYIHNQVKKQVLDQLIQVAKLAYMNGTKAQYVLDSKFTKMLQVDGDLINDSEYGVFISGSPKDLAIIDQLKEVANMAVQNQQMKLSDLIKVYKSTSMSEIEAQIISTEREKEAREQQQFEQTNQTQIQIQEMANQAAKERMLFEAEKNQLDRENKLEVAQITALGFGQGQDTDGDGTPDIVEQGKLFLEQSKFEHAQSIDKMKLSNENKKLSLEASNAEAQRKHEAKLADKNAEIKKKEMENKKQIAKMRPKPKSK